MRWRDQHETIPWHPPRAVWFGAVLIWAVILFVASSIGAEGQVSAEVTLENGQAMALVRNTNNVPVAVQVRAWESDETGDKVQLTRQADVSVWPPEFRLDPGERQHVRLLMREGDYQAGTLLRLETILTPLGAARAQEGSAREATTARFNYRYRILSKLHVGR